MVRVFRLFLFLFFQGFFSIYAQIDLVSNILVNYPFSGSAIDVGPNSLSGTVFGNVTLTSDRFGNTSSAYDFGGTNLDYILVPHQPILNFNNQSFSIGIWAYRKANTFNGMLLYKGVDISDGYGLRVNADGLGQNARFRLGNPSRWFFDSDDISTFTDIQNFVWTHYTGVYDAPSQTMRMYEDGVLTAEKTIVVPYTSSNNAPLTFGQHSTNATRTMSTPNLYPYAGALDDIIIYGRALSACEAYSLGGDVNTCFGINDRLRVRHDFCGSGSDLSGNNNDVNITYSNYVAGRSGSAFSAVSLSGISGGLMVTENQPANFGSQSFAISVWFKTNTTAVSQIVSKGFDNFSDGYSLSIHTDEPGALTFGIGSGGMSIQSVKFRTQNNQFANNAWHHVVISVDRSKNKIWMYADGLKQDLIKIDVPGTGGNFLPYNKEYDISALPLQASSTQPLVIGANAANNEKFAGIIDDLRIYARALIPGEAKLLYHTTASGNCCPPFPPPSASPASVCGVGSNVLLTASGAALYSWYTVSVGGSLQSLSETFTYMNIQSSDTIYAAGYYGPGCESSARKPIPIDVFTLPSAPVVSANYSVCGINIVTLTASGTGIIQWFSNTTSGLVLSVGGVYQGLVSTSGSFYVNQIDHRNCTSRYAQTSVQIVNHPVRPVITFADSSVCPNQTFVFYKAAPTIGIQHFWNVVGGTIVGSNITDSLVVNWGNSNALAGVTVVGRNAIGCESPMAYARVIVNTLTTTQLPTGNNPVCYFEMKNQLYQISPTYGGQYNWTILGAVIDSQNAHQVILSATSPGIIRLRILESVTTSSDICTHPSDIFTVTVLSSPDTTLRIYGATQICMGSESFYSVPGLSLTTVNWNLSSGILATVTSNTLRIIAQNSGLKTVAGTMQNYLGCSAGIRPLLIQTDTLFRTQIDVLGQNHTTLGIGEYKNCLSVAFAENRLRARGFSNSTFLWSLSFSGASISGLTTTTRPELEVYGTGTGVLSLREYPQNLNTCENHTIKIPFYIRASPPLVWPSGTPDSLCSSEQAIQLDFPFEVGRSSGQIISWCKPISSSAHLDSCVQQVIKSISGIGNIQSTVHNFIFSVPGTYLLTQKITYAYTSPMLHCSNGEGARKTLFVKETPRAATITGNSTLCRSNTTNVLYSVSGLHNLPTSYAWSVTGIRSSVRHLENTPYAYITFDTTQYQQIILVQETLRGCKGPVFSKQVTLDLPVVALDYVGLSENSENVYVVRWKPVQKLKTLIMESGFTTILGSSVQSFTGVAQAPDSLQQVVMLQISDFCGNAYITDKHASVLLSGRVDAMNGAVNLTWLPYEGWPEGVEKYEIFRKKGNSSNWELWNTQPGSSYSVYQLVATEAPVQEFRAKAYQSNGPNTSYSNVVRLFFDKDIQVYTGFTPNGDDKNKYWIIDRIQIYPESKVTVFDKWGNIVYEKIGYTNDWDGTSNGKELPPGSYYYLIDLKNNEKPKTGVLTIIR